MSSLLIEGEISSQKIELTLSNELTKEDYERTEWILSSHKERLMVVENYKQVINDDLSQLFSAGITNGNDNQRKRRELIHGFNEYAVKTVEKAIECLYDSRHVAICELLFIKGIPFLTVQQYMDDGYEGLYPMAPTTFAENRRKLIWQIAFIFSIEGLLDYVFTKIEPGKKNTYGFGLSNLTDKQTRQFELE